MLIGFPDFSCSKIFTFQYFKSVTPFVVREWYQPEMITNRLASWISGRIVSLQPDTDIQKLLSNGNRIRIRISETLLSIFLEFRLLEILRIAQSFIYYLQKHLFCLLCHDFQFVYDVISAA